MSWRKRSRRSQPKKNTKRSSTPSSTGEDDDDVQVLEFIGGRGLSASEVSSKTGEEHLLKWMTLLSEDGNTPEHNIARVIAMQCQEIASHPLFRPMFSDVSPTFICLDKRDSKHTKFYNPCEAAATKKGKSVTIKQEKDRKTKHDKSGKVEKDKKKQRLWRWASVLTIISKKQLNISHIHIFYIWQGYNVTSSGAKKQPPLFDRQCFGLLGESLCLFYPFQMLEFEKIFFTSNRFDFNDLLMILFPQHQVVPWSNKRHLIKHIVTTVHSLLETAHSEKFQESDTLNVLWRFRKQMRFSYYTSLSHPDNIPRDATVTFTSASMKGKSTKYNQSNSSLRRIIHSRC